MLPERTIVIQGSKIVSVDEPVDVDHFPNDRLGQLRPRFESQFFEDAPDVGAVLPGNSVGISMQIKRNIGGTGAPDMSIKRLVMSKRFIQLLVEIGMNI